MAYKKHDILLPTTIEIYLMDNRKCCCTSNEPSLPTTTNIHLMDDKNCCCTSKPVTRKCPCWGGRQLQPESCDSGHKLPVEEAFSHALPKHEFFYASTSIVPRQAINNIQKKKTKRKSGVYVSPNGRSRYSSKYIISLDELIVWML